MIPIIVLPYDSHINHSCNALTQGSSTGRLGPKTLGCGNSFSHGTLFANGRCVINNLPSPKGSKNGTTILALWSTIKVVIVNGAIATILSTFGMAPPLALLAFVSSRLV